MDQFGRTCPVWISWFSSITQTLLTKWHLTFSHSFHPLCVCRIHTVTWGQPFYTIHKYIFYCISSVIPNKNLTNNLRKSWNILKLYKLVTSLEHTVWKTFGLLAETASYDRFSVAYTSCHIAGWNLHRASCHYVSFCGYSRSCSLYTTPHSPRTQKGLWVTCTDWSNSTKFLIPWIPALAISAD